MSRGIKVIETKTGWMIRCRCRTEGWHEFPKVGKPGASWSFNGDRVNPTFSPSMNSCLNPTDHKDYQPDFPTSRCHFIVTAGRIAYCGDCTHPLVGQTLDLDAWPDVTVDYYDALLKS